MPLVDDLWQAFQIICHCIGYFIGGFVILAVLCSIFQNICQMFMSHPAPVILLVVLLFTLSMLFMEDKRVYSCCHNCEQTIQKEGE